MFFKNHNCTVVQSANVIFRNLDQKLLQIINKEKSSNLRFFLRSGVCFDSEIQSFIRYETVFGHYKESVLPMKIHN